MNSSNRDSTAPGRDRIREVMEKIRHIEIRTRRLVEDSLAGSYHSVFRGRGLDFDRVREYVPGDEVRTIDWNVTARAGRPFVKQFHEERELTVWLLIDVSASGDFGSGSSTKRDLMAELACVLALSAVRNNDKVGLIMFSDRIEVQVPPAQGRGHALRLVRDILTCRPQGRGTDIEAALQLAALLARRRAVMFLLSDFEFPADHGAALRTLERAARPIGARHDVMAIEVRDRHEQTLPNLGLVTLEDAETGEVIDIDSRRASVRKAFAARAAARTGEVRRVLRRVGIETLPIDPAEAYLLPLLGFFAARERRRP